MGQQLRMRYKRQRRIKWIDRKKKADKAKVKPAVAKTPSATLARSDCGLGEKPAKPAETNPPATG